AERGEEVHDFRPSAKSSDGKTAADDFAETGEIGNDFFQLLHAAPSEPKAGHDFVENEQTAVCGTSLANVLQITGVRLDETDVADVRLKNDTRDFAGIGGEGSVESRGIVERQNNRFLGERGGYTRAVGMTVGERARTGFDQQRITVAMITAGKFDDLVALGETPREADGRHRRFSAAVAETDLLNRREKLHDQFGHLDFVRVGRAEGGAVFERGRDSGFDARVIVSVDRGAPGADEVDQLTIVR